MSNAQKRAVIKAREAVPGAPAPQQHAQGPRHARRSFGITNRNTVVRLSEVLSVSDGKPVISWTASPRAPKRSNFIADAPGAKLVAHQRGAGYQHEPDHPAFDAAAYMEAMIEKGDEDA